MTALDRNTLRILFTTLVFTLVMIIAYVVRSVLIIFAFSILFAYLINPVVRFLQRHSLFFKNLRGPHVVEAYLAFIIAIVLLFYGIAPNINRSFAQLMDDIPALGDRVSSGEIANDLQGHLGWSDTQAARIKKLLEKHRATIERYEGEVKQFASTAAPGLLVIPILAIFFLSDGERLANHIIDIVSTGGNRAAVRSLADELHVMLQHYIRAKVILGGLSFGYSLVGMLVLGFPNAAFLAILAGVLEFIPVAGWMTAAAVIVTVGALAHAHWIWMLVLLLLWRVLMDYAIAPRVMGHELEIHPLLAIFTLMVGGKIGGVVGIYLSVPLVATLRVVYRRFIAPPAASTSSAPLLTEFPKPTTEEAPGT